MFLLWYILLNSWLERRGEVEGGPERGRAREEGERERGREGGGDDTKRDLL